MASVIGVFLLLLIICCAAGYPVLRYFGKGLPDDQRIAALPLAGAASLALLLQWVHVALPLGRAVVLITLAFALLGAGLLTRRGLQEGDLRRPKNATILAISAAIFCVLIPFWTLGRPTSFGIINNDAFFYAAGDYLVQHTRYTDTAPASILAGSAAGIRRYGIDYLSTVTQAVTGMRSWETVQLTGAFGLLLSMAAGYLLARGLGASRRSGAIAGITIGMSHWIFRLYMEAMLGFMFGLPFLLACLWACTLQNVRDLPARSRTGLAATMLCGLMVFYFDLVPIVVVLVAAGMAVGWVLRQRFAFPLGAILGLAVVPFPVLRQAVSHFLLVSSVSGPGKHFNSEDLPRTILHFAGMMDLYDYMYWPDPITPIHVAGAAAVMILAGIAIVHLPHCKPALTVVLAAVLPMMALCVYVAQQGREYHAHRTICVATAFAIPALSAALSRVGTGTQRARVVMSILVAVMLAGVSQSVWRVLARFDQQNIIVTPFEKEIGHDWLPRLADSSVVFIELTPDAPAFQSHYLYLESVYGMNGNESRVLIPNVKTSYLVGAPPLGAVDLARATHVLRVRGALAMVTGALIPVASNERYELLAVRPGTRLFLSPAGLATVSQAGATPFSEHASNVPIQ